MPPFPQLWLSAGVLVVAMGALVVIIRIHRRARAALKAQIRTLQHIADERAVALEYIVRARVVDYVYEFVGYRITIGDEPGDEVRRILVFSPPKNKDIICKRITLAEGQRIDGGVSVRDFAFEASVHKPLPDLVDDEEGSPLSPQEDASWQFESHPWVLDVPPDASGEVRAILVFTPMISEIRRLVLRYRWPRFFPDLHAGSSTAGGHFSTLKPSGLLELAVSLPRSVPGAHLTLFPPGGRDPVESNLTDGLLVCMLPNAPRGTYRYVIALEGLLPATRNP